MKIFLVERDLGSAPMTELSDMARACGRFAGTLQEGGDRIDYLGSAYLPVTGTCLCFFQAKSAEVVAEHARLARLPVSRINEAQLLGKVFSGIAFAAQI